MKYSPHAAHHQVEGVFFKGQKLLVSQDALSRDLTLSPPFLNVKATKLTLESDFTSESWVRISQSSVCWCFFNNRVCIYLYLQRTCTVTEPTFHTHQSFVWDVCEDQTLHDVLKHQHTNTGFIFASFSTKQTCSDPDSDPHRLTEPCLDVLLCDFFQRRRPEPEETSWGDERRRVGHVSHTVLVNWTQP